MKQHKSALSRLTRLGKKTKEKKEKNNFSPPLTSLFLHQIVTSYNTPKQKNLLLHLLPHLTHPQTQTPVQNKFFSYFFIRFVSGSSPPIC
jgi:hypothetical protein